MRLDNPTNTVALGPNKEPNQARLDNPTNTAALGPNKGPNQARLDNANQLVEPKDDAHP
jgi:hypothetical protein